MAVIKMKPTSPGRRGVVKVTRDHLYKGAPHAALLEPQIPKCWPQQQWSYHYSPSMAVVISTITVWSTLCVTKTAFRQKSSVLSTIPTVQHTLALVCYADGERRYIIAPRGLEAGASIMSGAEAPIRAGNTLPIRNIPVGSTIHCIEMQIGKGAQIARSAGTSATLLAREGIYAQVRMRSGEVRKIHIECRATIGEVANEEHSLRRFGKAGVKRWMGIRPTVRGVVMNPVDHPHGGGEGKTGEGRHPVDPWGNLTKGYRTRNNKRTQVMIVSRRKK